MAKKQKKDPKLSPFWKPTKPGDKIAGKFQHFEKTQFGLALKLEGAPKIVPMGTVLTQLFASVHAKMKPGQHVQITYTGKNKRTSLYEVSVQGKALEREGGNWGKPASRREVDTYFEQKADLPF